MFLLKNDSSIHFNVRRLNIDQKIWAGKYE